LAIVAAAITTAVAVGVPWLPVEASREAERIAFTFWFMTGIAIFVFAGVAAVLLYSWKFRVKEGDLSDGPPIHGHSGLEIAWTIVPFILVTAVAVVSAIVLHDNTRAAPDQLRIRAIGQAFSWEFVYPNGKRFPNLRLPLNRQTVLTLESKDILHGFWVPEFYQKQDAVPGLNTHIGITPIRLGVFPVICIELCGVGHSIMRSEAIVMTQADYNKWYAATTVAEVANAAGTDTGKVALAAFTDNGCGACHTFGPAKATGKIGPDLDDLKSAAAKAGVPLETFIKESITDPNKYVAPSYQPGVMPPFATTIPADKLDALVQYLAANAK
jgi:cytochrome c oxidase subunit 2